MKSKLFVVLPAALLLIAASALWVRAAEGETGTPPCADIIGGTAAYRAPTYSMPNTPQAGWVNPSRLNFVETLAAPTCPDVLYGLVVLAENPLGGAPSVLSSQVVPGDGISSELSFDLNVSMRPAEDAVCIYLYTLGADGDSTTTPSNGNPHSQTINAPGAEVLDRAPDGGSADHSDYCNDEEASGSGQRGYN